MILQLPKVLQRHAYLIPTVAGQQLLAAMHMLASHSRLEACCGAPAGGVGQAGQTALASTSDSGAWNTRRCFAAAEPSEAPDGVHMTGAALQRLHELRMSSPEEAKAALRLTVEAGGCSGFSYQFEMTSGPREDDRLFDFNGAQLLVDNISYEFVRGATVDFADELIKSTFEVVANPNASGKCGCGSSFTPKDA